MKSEPDPQNPGKTSKPYGDFAKESRSDNALEKDLWDLDEPLPSALSDKDDSGDEEPESDLDQSSLAPIKISPRSTRKDLVFKQSLPKKQASTDQGGANENETDDEFLSRISTPATTDPALVDQEESPVGEADSQDSTKTNEESASDDAIVQHEAGLPDEEVKSDTPEAPIQKISLNLSKSEKLGLIGFAVLLLAGILFFFANSINKLPEEERFLTPGDLPIAGEKVSADEIKSYWREPDIAGGETVRHGTLLVPVVELGVSGGGAVRVFFRDSDGATVGDGVTRTVNGKSTITITATAGFDDQGMFAAYRTGETKSWKIEVFEGSSIQAPGSEFKKLFEMPISTQRR